MTAVHDRSGDEPDWRQAASLTGARILVVEDDEELARAVAEHLRAEGFAASTTADGDAALAALSESRFDAVVLDLMIPGSPGIDVCRDLRSRHDRVPVLMATALGTLDERIAGFAAGADDYVVKPYDMTELVARLRAILRRAAGPVQSYLAVGDLTLDVLTRRAWRGRTPVDLAPRELELLELFMRHPGVVLTRHTILRTVWGGGASPSENVVDQYVARLRRKIDRPFGRGDLQTLHRVGWRLQPPPERRSPPARPSLPGRRPELGSQPPPHHGPRAAR